MNATIDLAIRKGSTFSKVLRWGSGSTAYDEIEAVLKTAPCRIVAPSHGIPTGWVVQLESIAGIRGLPTDEWLQVNRLDANTLELKEVNGSTARGTYQGGGYLAYNKPVDMTGYTARMQIREYTQAPEVLAELTTDNGGIHIDVAGAAVLLHMEAAQTSEIAWRTGVYDLEMVAPDGTVTQLASGTILTDDEVTR